MDDWILVSDDLPKGECIAYDALYDVIGCGYRSTWFEGIEMYNGKDDCDVTHWKPLPEDKPIRM